MCDEDEAAEREPALSYVHLATGERHALCDSQGALFQVVVTGLRGLLLVLLVLQVCVAITASVFSFKAIRRHRCSDPFKVSHALDAGLLPSLVEQDSSDQITIARLHRR